MGKVRWQVQYRCHLQMDERGKTHLAEESGLDAFIAGGLDLMLRLLLVLLLLQIL